MRWLPAGIVLIYLALAAGFSLATPLGEGPDEPGHAKYVFFLAREGRLPVQCPPPCAGDVPGEGHQPPLAYALMAPALLWLPQPERTFDLPGNRRFMWAGGDQLRAAAHGTRELWPWDRAVTAWRMARLLNVALGAGAVALTYLAGRRLLGERAALLGAALIALSPQFLFTAGLVTNDALLATLSALLLWLMAGGRGPQRRRALAVGAALGLALITKQSALLLAPLAGLWCLLAERPQRTRAWLAGALARGLAVAAAALALGGWWYLRNWQLYGDPLALAVFQAEFATQPFAAGSPAAWLGALALLLESLWARFGWMNLPAPRWALALYALLMTAGLAGLTLSRAWRRAGQLWLIWAPPLLALAWLTSFALTAGLVAWQGRLLFPALPAIALALGAGLAALPQLAAGARRRAAWGGLLAGLAGLAGLAAWLPWGVIAPAYPPQALTAAEAVRRIAAPQYARFVYRGNEAGAVLRSARVDGEARPGAELSVTLIWSAHSRQNRDWWVFIHLVDGQEQILAEANGEPRGARFPMREWVAGDWIEDTHTLALPASLAPGSYRLRVGLWYPNTGRRAARLSADGRLLGDSVDTMIVTVRP